MELQPPFNLGRQVPAFLWYRGKTVSLIAEGESGEVDLLDGDDDSLSSSPRRITARSEMAEVPADTLVYVIARPPIKGTQWYIWNAKICGA